MAKNIKNTVKTQKEYGSYDPRGLHEAFSADIAWAHAEACGLEAPLSYSALYASDAADQDFERLYLQV